MHAYLITGPGENCQEKIDELVTKNKLERFDFPLIKIADVRELTKFTRLTLTKPTGVVIENFDVSSEEAQNAFLKNLEEPQQALTYILTASSPESVLPTISSRCQVVEVTGKTAVDDKTTSKIQKFLQMSQGERFLATSKITNREDAINFLEELILGTHNLLGDNPHITDFIENADQTLKNLEANGNVQLQLTNFVVNIDDRA